MYTTYISTNTQFLLFIGKLQGGPNNYPLLVYPVYCQLECLLCKVETSNHAKVVKMLQIK